MFTTAQQENVIQTWPWECDLAICSWIIAVSLSFSPFRNLYKWIFTTLNSLLSLFVFSTSTVFITNQSLWMFVMILNYAAHNYKKKIYVRNSVWSPQTDPQSIGFKVKGIYSLTDSTNRCRQDLPGTFARDMCRTFIGEERAHCQTAADNRNEDNNVNKDCVCQSRSRQARSLPSTHRPVSIQGTRTCCRRVRCR